MPGVLDIEYTKEVIDGKRAEIIRRLVKASHNIDGGSVKRISGADLRIMYELYDDIFFMNWFKNNYRGKMKFSLSRRMTKSAGLTLCPRNSANIKPEELTIEIRIGIDLIFQYGITGGSRPVCGIRTDNSLDALLLVFEHELCHAVEFVLSGKSSCKGERFRSIAFRLFGHTERYHTLPVIKQLPAQKSSRQVGETVKFCFKGKELTGLIYSINKRAAVMVRDTDGRYSDRKGNLYTKYYIPLNLLQ